MSNSQFYLKSMTAYGRGSSSFIYGDFIIEIQSVNRRYLEVNVTAPRLFNCLEMDLRKKIAQQVGRGTVNVSIKWHAETADSITVTPNLSLAKEIKKAYEQLQSVLKLESKIDLSILAREKEILLFEEKLPDEQLPLFSNALESALDQALEHLLAMKSKEGNHLCQDLVSRAQELEKCLAMIEAHAPLVPKKYQQKLTERLIELAGSIEHEERLLREIALFAEKADITEEIVRFKSHLQQFEHMLEKPLIAPNETRGKMLDFFIQELNREINTMGSKASDLLITEQVIIVKSTLEKMREQVQNIE